MKLILNPKIPVEETEVIINCMHVDAQIEKVADYIRQINVSLEGEEDGKIYSLSAEQILYIDSADGKTFLYDRFKTYGSRKTLVVLERELACTPFVRISKNCLLNTSHLKCVEPYINHRMKAMVEGGESLIVSRKYIAELKEKIKRGGKTL